MNENATCSRCGAEMPGGARFCSACGAAVVVAAAVPPPPPAAAPPPPPPPAASGVPSPPPAYYQAPPPARTGLPVGVIVLIVGVVFLGLVAIAGITAWLTLGTRVSQTVATATRKLPSGTVISGAPTPGPAPTPVPASHEQHVIQVGDSTKPDEPPTPTPVEDVSLAGVGEGEHVGPVTSGDQAAALVLGTPDAETWAAQIAEARKQGKKRHAMVTVERKPNGHYLVHAYEDVEDDDPGHTATFGWFDVDDKMGAIKSETVDSD